MGRGQLTHELVRSRDKDLSQILGIIGGIDSVTRQCRLQAGFEPV